ATSLLAAQGFVIKDPEPWIIFLLALGVAIVLGNMAGNVTPRGAGLGRGLAGAGLGPNFPTLFGLVLMPVALKPRGAPRGVVCLCHPGGHGIAGAAGRPGACCQPREGLAHAVGAVPVFGGHRVDYGPAPPRINPALPPFPQSQAGADPARLIRLTKLCSLAYH